MAKFSTAGTMMLLALAVQATEPPQGVTFERTERRGWRLSVGPAFNFNVRADVRANRGLATGLIAQMGSGSTGGASDKEAARRRVTGESDPDGVQRYAGGAWINPTDERGVDGTTWNYNLPSAAALIRNGRITLSSASYSSSSSKIEASAGDSASSDTFNAPGVTLELSREVWYSEDWNLGLDVAAGFSWFFRNDVLRAEGELARRTDTVERGKWTRDVDVWYLEDTDGYNFNADGSLGTGSAWGPGPILDLASVGDPVARVTDSSSTTHTLGYSARGGYNEFEFTLAARPYWEPWEWLRLYGTLGVGVSYMRLSYSSHLYRDGGSVFRESGVANDWDVYGFGGLGLLLRYGRFSLGADVMARFWTSDLEFDTQVARGSLSRGTWLVRCMLGFEF